MIIGPPKEIKDNEYRMGLTPAGVRASLIDESVRGASRPCLTVGLLTRSYECRCSKPARQLVNSVALTGLYRKASIRFSDVAAASLFSCPVSKMIGSRETFALLRRNRANS